MKQEKIIYAFRMDESGRLICTPIDNYEVKENLRGEKSYRFRLNGFIKHKTDRQLDKFLNNYFYTFNPDKRRARTMIAPYGADANTGNSVPRPLFIYEVTLLDFYNPDS